MSNLYCILLIIINIKTQYRDICFEKQIVFLKTIMTIFPNLRLYELVGKVSGIDAISVLVRCLIKIPV